MAKFPDLTGDGKVTQADILKGRGVEGMKRGGSVPKGMHRMPDGSLMKDSEHKGMKKGGSTDKWIQSAIKKRGALRSQLGIGGEKPIPTKMLAKAAKAPGKLGKRARLAQTLRKMK